MGISTYKVKNLFKEYGTNSIFPTSCLNRRISIDSAKQLSLITEENHKNFYIVFELEGYSLNYIITNKGFGSFPWYASFYDGYNGQIFDCLGINHETLFSKLGISYYPGDFKQTGTLEELKIVITAIFKELDKHKSNCIIANRRLLWE